MDEGQWLQDVLLQDVHFGELLFGLSDQAFLNETDCLSYPNAASRLMASWWPHWDLHQRFLIEKSPMNIVRTRFLQKLFPRSIFVMTIRDPRTSFMAARKTMPLVSPETYFRSWVQIYSAYIRDARRLRCALFVPLEALLQVPQVQLGRLRRLTRIPIMGLGGTQLRPGDDQTYARAWDEQVDVRTKNRCNAMLPDWCFRYGYKHI